MHGASHNRMNIKLKSFAVGFVAFALGIFADWLSRSPFTPGVLHGPLGYLDDFVLAVFAGLIVLRYERLRTRDLRRRLVLTRDVNHDVRNDLETVVRAAAVQSDARIGHIIRHAVERIDWTLREALRESESA